MSERVCSVCKDTFYRRCRYIKHVSNMRKCGNNVQSIITLLELKEYNTLDSMYNIALNMFDKSIGVMSLLKHAHEHITLMSANNDLHTKLDISHQQYTQLAQWATRNVSN